VLPLLMACYRVAGLTLPQSLSETARFIGETKAVQGIFLAPILLCGPVASGGSDTEDGQGVVEACFLVVVGGCMAAEHPLQVGREGHEIIPGLVRQPPTSIAGKVPTADSSS